MLGWHVSVYRKATDRSLPATDDSATDVRLAVWQTDVFGLRWLDDLQPDECELLTDNSGYPTRYTGKASAVVPVLRSGPPGARAVWHVGADAVVVDATRWDGRTVIDEAAIEECDLDEWLLIEAWDED